MEDKQAPRKRRGRLIAGIVIGLIVLIAVAAAVIIGVIYGLNKDDDAEESELPLFLSVQSFGTSDDITTFTVRYRAKESCFVERRFNSASSNLLGREVLIPQRDDDGVSSVRIQADISQDSYLDVTVYCHRVLARLVFEPDALSTPGSQTVVNQTDAIPFNILSAGLNGVTGEYDVVVSIDEEKSLSYFFNGLNTSTPTPVPFEYIEYDNSNITGVFRTAAEDKDDVKEYTIAISKELVDAGGFFTIHGRTRVRTKYIRDIGVGRSILIRSPITGEIVPSGKYGFYPIYKDSSMDIFVGEHSFWCYIMGNPLPGVDIYVRKPDNTTTRLESDDLRFDEYSRIAVVRATKDEFPEGGTFICRSNPGDAVHEVEFSFQQFEASIIVNSTSGIIEQTPEQDVVRCTARGRPLPIVRIRLYDTYGPDLSATGLFQVSRSNTSDTVTSVTLTVSPPNKDIHTVHCEADQPGFPETEAQYQEVVLYPGREDNYTLRAMMWTAIGNN